MIPTPGRQFLGEPPEELRELIDEVGMEGVMEAFEAMMGGGLPEDIFNDDELDSFAPPAKKPGKPRRKKRRGSARTINWSCLNERPLPGAGSHQ